MGPKVSDLRSQRREFLERGRCCPIVYLCLWCPAHSCMETGEPGTPIDYFCQVGHAWAAMLTERKITDAALACRGLSTHEHLHSKKMERR